MSKEVEEAIKDLEKYISFSKKTDNFEHDSDYWHKELAEKIETVLKHIKELEEEKRITELTKISCCTAQNCGALENAIKKDLENDKLKKQLADTESDLTSVYLKRSI